MSFTRNFTRQKPSIYRCPPCLWRFLFPFSTVEICRLRLFFLIYRPLVTFHTMKSLHTPTWAFLIKKLLTALSRQKSCDVRLPISKPILHDLVSSLQHTNSSAAQRILFSAMFLTAFYGFFRIGELAARSACHTTVISYDNIRFLASGGKIHSIKITITHFKHISSNHPFNIVIPGDESSPFCPMKFILRYCNLRGNKPGPLFCHADNTPITVNHFNTELRRCLNFCGLNPQRYKSHRQRFFGRQDSRSWQFGSHSMLQGI